MDRDRFDAITRNLPAALSRRGAMALLVAGPLALLTGVEPGAGKRKRKRKKRRKKQGKPSGSLAPPTCLGYSQSILTGCALDDARCCSGVCWPIPSHCLRSGAGQACLVSADCDAGLGCVGYRCR